MKWRVALLLLVILLSAGMAMAQDLDLRLHAWDGKSDPYKDPKFEWVEEDGAYVVRNQKCYAGMEFGVLYYQDYGGRVWLGGVWDKIVPGHQNYLVQRTGDRKAVNFKITEEGVYDFILNNIDPADYMYIYQGILGSMVVKKHRENPEGLRLDGTVTVTKDERSYSYKVSWDLLCNTGGFYSYVYNNYSGVLEADLNNASDERLAKVVLPQDDKVTLILVDRNGENVNNYYLGYSLNYTLNYREAGSDAEFQKLTVDSYGNTNLNFSTDHGLFIGMVDIPANTEFYLASATQPLPDPNLDIMPVSEDVLVSQYKTEWDVAPRAYGAPGNIYFKTGDQPYHGILKFNPVTMQLRLEVPDEGPWDLESDDKEKLPQKLYLHGVLPLEDNPIDDWGGYHDELAADMVLEGEYEWSKQAVYYFDLNLTDDAWFRIFTEENAVTGRWWILGATDNYSSLLRGCWAPASDINVEVPNSRFDIANSWCKPSPEDGAQWHIPAGKWHLVVKFTGEGPNKPQLYCYKDTENTEEYSLQIQDDNSEGGQGNIHALSLDEFGNYVGTFEVLNATTNPSYHIGLVLRKYTPDNKEGTPYIVKMPEGMSIYDPDDWAQARINTETKICLSYVDGEYIEGLNPWIKAGPKGRYKFTFNPTNETLTFSPDYSKVHMPLKPEDFVDMDGNPRSHYFIVGSRTADFRLLPEWELTPENNYTIENRLMYPGMFGIAQVDNYDDYIYHNFKLWYVSGEMSATHENNGQVLNASGEYPLTIHVDTDYEYDVTGQYVQVSKIINARAIKDYGDYYSYHDNYSNPWPFIVLQSMQKESNSNGSQKVTSWWHFTDFAADETDEYGTHYSRETLAKAFKKGTPSLASSIGIKLADNGNPEKLLIGPVKTWKENKADVLREVNFFMVGTDFINERPYGDTRYLNPQNTTLYGYTNVSDWANQWIQYDPESGQAYMDGDGKYLFQTVYQDSWIKDHPTLFYRAADNTVYDSNSLRLRSLAELAAAGDDKFEGYYRDMQDKKLGDGTLKKYTDADAPVKYDFYDRVGAPDPHVGMAYRKGDIEAPMAEGGWQPYALSDLTFGGWFKVWSGFGGGHEGFGSWTDNVEVGDAYAWFNMNVGHSMARNPLRVKAGEVEVNASESTPEAEAEKDRLVNFYLTGKDDPAADFMTREVDGAYPLRTYKRLILWLNTTDRTDLTDNSTSGMAKSYVQLVVSDLSPVIKARHGEVDHSVVYAWNLVKENMFDDKTVTAATVTVYRDGEVIGTYPQPEAVGKLTSECTAEGMFSQTLTDCLAGEYWMKVDVTYDDGVTKDAVSNHIHIYDEVYPALLTAWQRTATVGDRTLYGFNVSGTVGLPETDENRAFKEYTDGSGVKKRLYLKDLISHFLVSYKVPEADILTKRVEYVPGETTEFLLKLDGSDRVTVKAQAVAKESPLTVDGQTVELTANEISLLENTLATEAVELTLPIAKVNVTARSIDTEDFDTEADITAHPGHTDATPVRYRKVNSMNSTLEIEDNALLEAPEGEQETVSYTLAAANGRLSVNADGTSARVTHADAFTTEDNLFRSENTYTLTTEYRRGDVLLKGVADKTVTDDEWERELPRPARITVEDEDIALRGARKNWNGKYGMLCELRIFVPNSVNDGVSASDIVYLGGFDRPEGIDAAPVVKAPEDLKGGFLLISDKHADKFMGLEGATIGGSFLEWNGTQTWCENHDWAHAVAREGFALNFVDAVFYEGQDFASYTDGVSSPAFTVKTYNVYPFLVESGSAEAKAPTRAASAADNLKLLSLDGLITVPEKNWNDKVFTGIGEAYGPAEGPVDVYTTTGQLVMRGVTRAEALRTLQPGLYLVGNEKIMVK